MDHPSYSPDLVLSDYFQFFNFKVFEGKKIFKNSRGDGSNKTVIQWSGIRFFFLLQLKKLENDMPSVLNFMKKLLNNMQV